MLYVAILYVSIRPVVMRVNEELLVLHFSGRFLLTASLGRWRISMSLSLFTVAIPVNYNAEFWELFEDTTH